jgi:hypothetical protein
MGGKHSRLFRYRRRVPPIPPIPSISIPNYKYPQFIFSYLMSQSGGYKITFTTPNGESGNVSMPSNEPQPVNTSTISSTAAPTPQATTPQATTRPAYSTGLTTPPAGSSGSNSSSGSSGSTDTKVLSPSPYVAPGIPPFWVAAIWAMAMTDDIGEIKDYNTLKLFYETVANKIKEIMGDGSNGVQNVSALIYFCTIISRLFEPFREKFVYNYLNQRFPEIFFDAFSYQRFIIIYIYYTKCSNFLNNFNELGKVVVPVSGYYFEKSKLENMNPQKLFNYMLQNIESAINTHILIDIHRLLRGKKTKIILYVYDSMLFDVGEGEEDITLEIDKIFKNL